MATAKEIQDKADAVTQPLIDSIISIQDEWVKTHKGYWQGIRTPKVVPAEGLDTAPDLTVKPVSDDEAASWSEFKAAMPTDLPCAVEVHTHDGPQGQGFTIYSTIQFGVQVFVKATGTGPHSNTHVWIEQKPIEASI